MTATILLSNSDPLLYNSDQLLVTKPRQAKLEKMAEYNGEPGFFIKVWVIDDTKNDNGWHVSRESILPGMKTALEPRFFSPEFDSRANPHFKNVAPLISMPDYQDPSQRGHPSPYGKDIITRQAPYRVGNFIAVGIEDDYNSGIRYGWAIIKIFNEKIQEEINNGDDIFFSPSLMPLRTVNGIDTEWRFNHHAIVDQPAYGSKAHMLGRCTGGSQCVHMLAKQAKSLHVQAVHGGCTKVCNSLPSLSDPLLQVRQANTLPSLSDPLLTVAQQAAKEEETWITVKGTPVKIEDGQTKEDAVKDFLAKKEKEESDKSKDTATLAEGEYKGVYMLNPNDISYIRDAPHELKKEIEYRLTEEIQRKLGDDQLGKQTKITRQDVEKIMPDVAHVYLSNNLTKSKRMYSHDDEDWRPIDVKTPVTELKKNFKGIMSSMPISNEQINKIWQEFEDENYSEGNQKE